MTYYELRKKATPGPFHMDNCFMLCDKHEEYIAQLDASEDPKHKAMPTGRLLAHCFNRYDELLEALKTFVEHEMIMRGPNCMYDGKVIKAVNAIESAENVEGI